MNTFSRSKSNFFSGERPRCSNMSKRTFSSSACIFASASFFARSLCGVYDGRGYVRIMRMDDDHKEKMAHEQEERKRRGTYLGLLEPLQLLHVFLAFPFSLIVGTLEPLECGLRRLQLLRRYVG